MKTAPFFLVVFVLLAGCSSIKVEHNYDDTVDFAPYQTYAFHDEETQVEGTLAPRVAVARAVKDEIDSELSADGYRKVTDNPDFLVAFHVSVIDPVSASYNPGRYTAWGQGSSMITTVSEGTLIVDIIDAESNELVWRGTASGGVERGGDSDKAAKKIHDAVHKVMAKFPPR